MTQTDADRLDRVVAVLLKDGWPDWFDSSFVNAGGPTVRLRPGTPEHARLAVEDLCRRHGVTVTEGSTEFRFK